MKNPPCENKPVFSSPEHATAEQIGKAIAICQHCPLIRECAQKALKAGTPPDLQQPIPATGVIQAGVWCTGDKRTRIELHKLLDLPAPQPIRHRRTGHPERCVTCKQPMVARKFGQPTHPNILTHTALGMCRKCYAHHRKEITK